MTRLLRSQTFFLSPHHRRLGRRHWRKTIREIPTIAGDQPGLPIPAPTSKDLHAPKPLAHWPQSKTLIDERLGSRRRPVPSLTRLAARGISTQHAPGDGERHAASVSRLAGGSFSLGGGVVGGGNLRHGGLNTSGIGSATTSAAHFIDFRCSVYLYYTLVRRFSSSCCAPWWTEHS
jgi:hypothetical protein